MKTFIIFELAEGQWRQVGQVRGINRRYVLNTYQSGHRQRNCGMVKVRLKGE